MFGPFSYGIVSQGGAALDADAAAIIAAMTTPPDGTRQALINTTVIALKAAGVWSLLDTLWVMAAHHEQAGRLNWKSPGNFTLATAGTITHTVDRGWQGNGTTGYLNTGWNPATNGVNYTLNDASFGVYSRTDAQNTSVGIGSRNVSFTNLAYFFPRSTGDGGNQFIGFANQNDTNTPRSATNSDSLGLHVMRRSSSTSISFFKDGASLGSLTKASTALSTIAFFIGAVSDNGTAANFDNRQYALAFTGAAMSATQQASLYSIFQTGYLADVGAAV